MSFGFIDLKLHCAIAQNMAWCLTHPTTPSTPTPQPRPLDVGAPPPLPPLPPLHWVVELHAAGITGREGLKQGWGMGADVERPAQRGSSRLKMYP